MLITQPCDRALGLGARSQRGVGVAQEEMFCDEFMLVDLRVFENCKKVCEKVDHVFNLAADMGGMGFIQSNHSVIMYNNTMISFNMLEAARQQDIKRCALCFHASLSTGPGPSPRACGWQPQVATACKRRMWAAIWCIDCPR